MMGWFYIFRITVCMISQMLCNDFNRKGNQFKFKGELDIN